MTRASALRTLTLHQLEIEDEAPFRRIGLFRDLKARLVRDDYRVRVMPEGAARWDHALLLNLAFWEARGGGDILVDAVVPADVVCHIGWHHLAGAALADGDAPLSGPALLLGEAIASAFDLYLIGRLLGHGAECGFLETQVPAMAEVAEGAGVEAAAFEDLLEHVRRDPEGSFEELRRLLFDVLSELLRAQSADEALQALTRRDGERFACLLHHFELANWLQHARAAPDNASADKARALDAELRRQPDALAWMAERWLA